jgi:prevent-host-death family protein
VETVGSYEAKTYLPKLLDRVAKGERITITKHGVPVAVLVPAPSNRRPDAASVIRALKKFRAGRRLGGISLREMIEEGRRF